MKVIKNKFIPFKGFSAMALFGLIWTRKDELDKYTINHERIHLMQEKELFYVGFYILYVWFYLYNLIKERDAWMAYRLNPFEREAYANDFDFNYIYERKKYAWKKFKN